MWEAVWQGHTAWPHRMGEAVTGGQAPKLRSLSQATLVQNHHKEIKEWLIVAPAT